ncbi:MAG: hypothetical protein E7337_01355 [Clostridiales bacterium]|nr:hypothetical protein [Clostridiales bacterium]MBE5810091.1 hypothetical protein [Clostridiales bacterium]
MEMSAVRELNAEQKALLALVQGALFCSKEVPKEIDLTKLVDLANRQGVLSLLYLGAKRIKDQFSVDTLRSWRGDMLAGAVRNESVNAVQQEVLGLFAKHDIRSAILKGLSAARY